ncbi:inorganic diphosphatase [Rubrobacter tropicus]|uniref:inorganic diphosphatase n=1 Tax=Rubrobacter tropicus TaxID=2653851 RepID=UPI001A9FB64E|nr:inorganic diphosphatase [Rubrobacter tropicus]
MALDLEALPLGDDAPRVVNAVVEIPVGSRNKYEWFPGLGLIGRDRVLPGNVRYPVEYGFLPSTNYQGDPFDVLVAAYEPTFPGCVIKARPVGAMHLTDTEGEEHKILAVPDDDPRFDAIETIDDFPEQNLHEIEQFLEVYKRLEGDERAEVHGWLSLEETYDLIRKHAT